MTHAENTAFEPGTKRQVHWDSTSIGALKTCGRYYELSIVEGWAPRATPLDLRFGILLHSAREVYYAERARGQEHGDALRDALVYTFEHTFDLEAQRPWDSGDTKKNRLTLIRSLVWYCDQWENDPLKTILLSNGRPAVELTVNARLQGTPYTIWGHIDRLVEFNIKPWVSDLKTTGHTLDAGFYDRFSPDNQMSTYAWLANAALGFPVQGIIVDAAQVAVTFSRFHRGMVQRTTAQLAEWESSLRDLLAQNEVWAERGSWPMNERACFRCSFRPICARDPRTRQRWLEADFTRRVWNPTIERGDI